MNRAGQDYDDHNDDNKYNDHNDVDDDDDRDDSDDNDQLTRKFLSTWQGVSPTNIGLEAANMVILKDVKSTLESHFLFKQHAK